MAMVLSLINGINKTTTSPFLEIIRHASKKSRTSTRISADTRRPKHRGVKVHDSHFVNAGTLVATQRTPRFFPGLNVGYGKDRSLFSMEAGYVAITCEKVDPDWNQARIQRSFSGRQGNVFYKKYFNIIPVPQHQRFKLIDEI